METRFTRLGIGCDERYRGIASCRIIHPPPVGPFLPSIRYEMHKAGSRRPSFPTPVLLLVLSEAEPMASVQSKLRPELLTDFCLPGRLGPS